jgi:hypothetical protein
MQPRLREDEMQSIHEFKIHIKYLFTLFFSWEDDSRYVVTESRQ